MNLWVVESTLPEVPEALFVNYSLLHPILKDFERDLRV